MNIYISRNNQTSGPYNEAQVSEMLQNGNIVMTDLCSVDGTNWQPISEFTQPESSPAPVPVPPNNIASQQKPKQQTTKKIATQVPKKTAPKPVSASAVSKEKINEKNPGNSNAHKSSSSGKVASKESKKEYLAKLRSETLYPTLRIFFNIVFFLQLLLGIIIMIAGVINTIINDFEILLLVGSLISGIFFIATAFITKESGALLIDIADSQIETNSKNST